MPLQDVFRLGIFALHLKGSGGFAVVCQSWCHEVQQSRVQLKFG